MKNYFQLRLLYLTKLSIKGKVEEKTFSDTSYITFTSFVPFLGNYQNKNVNQGKNVEYETQEIHRRRGGKEIHQMTVKGDPRMSTMRWTQRERMIK